VSKTDDGLEALIFTADGDMRQAINNLQSTHYGFGHVNGENVFKICDRPHPILIQTMIKYCADGNVRAAGDLIRELYLKGYSALDIVTTMFRVVKSFDELGDGLQLDYLKEIGFAHMRIMDGYQSLLQLAGLIAKLCQVKTSRA
jgi:replication factor C subunit 2/4